MANSQTCKVIVSGLTGTTFMTAFSYYVSAAKNENFREPQLLAILAKRMIPSLSRKEALIIGWKLHYDVGLLFVSCYAAVWKKSRPGILSGLLLGALSGLIGIAVWKTVFSLHPNPPRIKYGNYYGHLFVTHLVFGAFAGIGYKHSGC